MAKTKVSINDIAKNLNISKTTVSFILNGKAKEKRISDKLVKKVLLKVQELGYQPNQLAQGLRTGKTNIIGLMVEDISNPFYANIAKKIEDKAYQNNYKIIYCSTENNQERAKEFLTMFTNIGVDGCIIAPTMGIEKEIKDLVNMGMNVVLFDRKFENMSTDVVMIDNQGGVYDAVEHLIHNNYKKIALIALALDKPEKEDRIIGYQKAMNDHGLNPLVFPFPFKSNLHDYVDDIKRILEQESDIEALVFGTNYLGISGLEAITSLNLRIPDDIAIISFDDHDLFRIHKPDITVVAQPIETIAQTAIDTLLQKLQGEEGDKAAYQTINLSTHIIPRASSQKNNHQ
ncbi:substrate-binding domain-containing protein [uncultured Draconibacterium sp.]|uniref:substrate-binding domain-containing protein n=1 Tax=uncultured Draconibacterium sp. TaxID=1573823 RepID=UPI0029C65795|nr:substrate-binding domain-containing protein [uncultured Draconibacterium sp.]